MNRRKFLVGGAAGVATVAGLNITGGAQAPAAGQAPAGGRQGAAPGRGAAPGAARGNGPAQVAPERLARISLMTLNFNSVMRLPWNTTPTPTQTIDFLDLPQYYMDHYGVPNIEYQHNHLVQGNSTPPDPTFLREVRAKQDAAKVTATQINIEIGELTTMSPEGQRVALSGDARATWLELAKKWADAAPILGVKRLMLNQTGLNQGNKVGVISVWKEIQDYARPKGIMISAEGRGAGGGRGAPGAAGAPAVPAAPAGPPSWILLAEVIEAAGGYSNIDIGGAGAPNQQALHDAIKGMFKSSAGNMHIKSSPNWDIGLAVRYTESLGYKGTYSIEVNPENAIRVVYNTIVAALA
jgi:hypothetical protein